jgi:hypothetical protein
MTSLPARVIVVAPGEDGGGRDGLASAVARLGTASHLAAPPIHAPRSLEAQACTGLGGGETGIFDDWRPQGYEPVPAPPASRLPRSVQEAARQAGLAVLDGPDAAGAGGTDGIAQLTEGSAREALMQDPAALTTLWLQPSTRVRVHNVLNPPALLAAAGLLEVDRSGRPDWERSLAYHVGHGQVWVNLRGREPGGIVQPGGEYEEVRAALRAVFAERLLDPTTGQSVVRVFMKEDLYSGAWLWAAPDLVLAPVLDCAFSPAAVAGRAEAEAVRREPALASQPGWWGVTGQGARRGGKTAPTDILRLAPTMAAVLGLSLVPAPSGTIVREALTDEFWASRPAMPASTAVLSADEERIIARRLGELGYIE